MIICRMLGGLGNQMFQYAAARSLSLSRGTELRCDIADYRRQTMHQGFELARVFKGSFTLAEETQVKQLLGWRRHPFLFRWAMHRALSPFNRSQVVVEPHSGYWTGWNGVPRHCYLSGYWQSERYFDAHAEAVRADFSFAAELEARNAELAGLIRGCQSVAVHVRRGDYVSNPTAQATHGTCSPGYYRRAIEHMVERVSSAQFFVFSDDMDWARSHLVSDRPMHFINHNRGKESFNDMRLMSLCQHHIVANSSFSWWGAWLAGHSTQLVVAPRRWFASTQNDADLVPARWVRL